MEPPEQIYLRQISPHCYWLPPDGATDRPLLGLVAGTKAALLVDAGNSPAHASLFLRELARLSLPPLRLLALTHWHWDHVFGAQTLNLPSLAHIETQRIVREMAGLDWSDEALDRRVAAGTEIAFCRDMMKAELPDRSGLVIKPPEIGLSSPLELDLGEVECRIVPVGGDHSADSCAVVAPREGVMFLGDCLSPDLYSGAPRYTARRVFALHELLLSFDIEWYLPAHSPQPWTRAELEEEARLLKWIGQEVERSAPDREQICKNLAAWLGQPPNEDQFEIVDAFLAGMRN